MNTTTQKTINQKTLREIDLVSLISIKGNLK